MSFDEDGWMREQRAKRRAYEKMCAALGFMLPGQVERDLRAARLEGMARELGVVKGMSAAEERLLRWMTKQAPAEQRLTPGEAREALKALRDFMARPRGTK